MSAIQQLIDYESDGNYLLADAAAQELAALHSEIANYETARQDDARRLEHVTAERDAYKKIIDDVRAGNYDNAHDITAARKFIFGELGKMPRDAAAALKGGGKG